MFERNVTLTNLILRKMQKTILFFIHSMYFHRSINLRA